MEVLESKKPLSMLLKVDRDLDGKTAIRIALYFAHRVGKISFQIKPVVHYVQHVGCFGVGGRRGVTFLTLSYFGGRGNPKKSYVRFVFYIHSEVSSSKKKVC